MGKTVEPVWNLEDYAFYADGTESGSVIVGSAGSQQTLNADTIYFCRIAVAETAGATTSPALTLRWQYNHNSGGWTDVGTTSPLQFAASSNVTDGGTTSDRIGGGGTFVAGRIFESQNDSATVYTSSGNDHTEALLVFTIDSAQVSDGDEILVRVVEGDGTVIAAGTGYTDADINVAVPAFQQVGFAFYQDGTESGSTIIGTANTQQSIETDTIFQIRVEINRTDSGPTGTFLLKPQYQINSGTWTDFNVGSTGIQFANSANLSNGGATTDRLSSGTGTFVAGRIIELFLTQYTVNIAGGEHTEMLLSVLIDSADVSNGDEILVRFVDDTNGDDAVFAGAYTYADIDVTAATTYPATAAFTGSGTFAGVGNVRRSATASASFAGAGSLETGTAVGVSLGTSVLGTITLGVLSVGRVGGTVRRGATAAFTGNGTFSAIGQAATLYPGSAAFTGDGTLTSTGSTRYTAAAAFTGDGSLAATGQQVVLYQGTAAFTGSGQAVSIGAVIKGATANFTGSAVFSGTAATTYAATASFNGAGAFAGNGQLLGTYDGLAAFDGAGSLSATATVKRAAIADFSAAGTFTAVGSINYSATAAFNGTGTFAATGSANRQATSAFIGSGTLAGSASARKQATAAFQGDATFDANGNAIYSASASFVGAGTLDANGTFIGEFITYPGTGVFNGSASFAATGATNYTSAASFTGDGTLTANGSRIWKTSASFNGNGTFAAVGDYIIGAITYDGTAAFTGSGTLSATGKRIRQGSASFTGSGTLTSAYAVVYGAIAQFTGQASLDANATSNLGAFADFYGSGTFSALGTHIHITGEAHPCRELLIEYESRTLTLSAEDRFYPVPYELRRLSHGCSIS